MTLEKAYVKRAHALSFILVGVLFTLVSCAILFRKDYLFEVSANTTIWPNQTPPSMIDFVLSKTFGRWTDFILHLPLTVFPIASLVILHNVTKAQWAALSFLVVVIILELIENTLFGGCFFSGIFILYGSPVIFMFSLIISWGNKFQK